MNEFLLLKKQAVPLLIQHGESHRPAAAQQFFRQRPLLGGEAGVAVEINVAVLAKVRLLQSLLGDGQHVFVVHGQPGGDLDISGIQQRQVLNLPRSLARRRGGLHQPFRGHPTAFQLVDQGGQPLRHLRSGAGRPIIGQGFFRPQNRPVHGQRPAAVVQQRLVSQTGLLQYALSRSLEGQRFGPTRGRVATGFQQPALGLVREHFRRQQNLPPPLGRSGGDILHQPPRFAALGPARINPHRHLSSSPVKNHRRKPEPAPPVPRLTFL